MAVRENKSICHLFKRLCLPDKDLAIWVVILLSVTNKASFGILLTNLNQIGFYAYIKPPFNHHLHIVCFVIQFGGLVENFLPITIQQTFYLFPGSHLCPFTKTMLKREQCPLPLCVCLVFMRERKVKDNVYSIISHFDLHCCLCLAHLSLWTVSYNTPFSGQ